MVLMKKRSKTQPCFFIVFAYAIPGTVVFAANRTFLRYLALRTTTNIHPRRDELLLDRQQLAVHLSILPSYLHNLLALISRLLSVRSPPLLPRHQSQKPLPRLLQPSPASRRPQTRKQHSPPHLPPPVVPRLPRSSQRVFQMPRQLSSAMLQMLSKLLLHAREGSLRMLG